MKLSLLGPMMYMSYAIDVLKTNSTQIATFANSTTIIAFTTDPIIAFTTDPKIALMKL